MRIDGSKLFRHFVAYIICLLPMLTFPAEGRNQAGESGRTEKRVALVIGNSAYRFGALENPRNDATSIAAAFKRLGFDVELIIDATKSDFDAAQKRFSAGADKADVATLFYAGHGIQADDQNFLVPIDAEPRSVRDFKREMVKLEDIIDDMGNAKVKLVFFDACRDNPLARSFSRGGSRGLAAPAETTGTLISFATKHGNTASDGSGKHSPYTAVLLTALESPVEEVHALLRKKVQQGVKAKTNGRQEPWTYGNLNGDFYFIEGSVNITVTPSVGTKPDAALIDLELWRGAQDIKTTEAYEDYLAKSPEGQFAGQAKAAITKLKGRTKPEPQVTNTAKAVARKPAQQQQDRATPTNKIFRDCPDCPEMVVIPEGSFDMGSNDHGGEKPIHIVTISRSFAIGKTEVTQGQWKAVMGSLPPELAFKDCGDLCPVERVSWNDAKEFVQQLSATTGKSYRLPSEAEWEYACRAGEAHEYCGSDDAGVVAWHRDNSGNRSHQAGQKQANNWGLYDMNGNVWEWVEDCRHDDYAGAPMDGSAWTYECHSASRVLRGGSWFYDSLTDRATNRLYYSPVIRSNDGGFRVARMLP